MRAIPLNLFRMAASVVPLMISKKHWITFIIPAAVLLTGCLVAGYTDGILRYLGWLILLSGLYRIVYLLSVKWQLFPDHLLVTEGIFPWGRTRLQIPVYHVYKAISSHRIAGYFLKYGTITIRRTDGVTTALTASRMAGAMRFCRQLNTIAQEYRLQADTPRNNTPDNRLDIGQELTRIVELKKKGELTQDEFEKIKAQLLKRI